MSLFKPRLSPFNNSEPPVHYTRKCWNKQRQSRKAVALELTVTFRRGAATAPQDCAGTCHKPVLAINRRLAQKRIWVQSPESRVNWVQRHNDVKQRWVCTYGTCLIKPLPERLAQVRISTPVRNSATSSYTTVYIRTPSSGTWRR